MEINLRQEGKALVIQLAGEFDLLTAASFREEIENYLDAHPEVVHLVLVLDRISFVDSSGLGAILGRYKRITQAGGKMVLVGLQPQVKRIFELSGLFKIMETVATETEALQALQGA